MTYKQWENKLSEYLCELPLAELQEILDNYRYKYNAYSEQGYRPSEILDSFGSPRSVSEEMIKKHEALVREAKRQQASATRQESSYEREEPVYQRGEPSYQRQEQPAPRQEESKQVDSNKAPKKKGLHGLGGLLFRLLFSLPFGLLAKALDLAFWVGGVALVVSSIGGLGYAIYSAILFLYGLEPLRVLACFSMGLISIGLLIIVGTIIRHISGRFSRAVKKVNRRVLKGERDDEEEKVGA